MDRSANRPRGAFLTLLLAGVALACGEAPPGEPPADDAPMGPGVTWPQSAQGSEFMIAAPTPEAVEAGVAVLEGGGNAVDAAVTAATVLWVTDPAMASVGGRAQILVHLADGRFVGVDGATQAPGELGAPAEIGHGYGTAPVPGAPAALERLLEQHGTLSWEESLAPAIRLAEEGFVLKEDLEEAFIRFQETLTLYEGSRENFFKPDGSAYSAGELFRQPALARTLEVLAREGSDALYGGSLAAAIVADMEANDGLVRGEDLAQYAPLVGPIVRGSYRGFEIAARGGNCDGASVIQMLQTLENFDLARYEITDPEYVHILAQTLRFATEERHGPDDIQISREHAAELARAIRSGRAGPSAPEGGGEGEGETNHLSVVDREGNAVAITQSIGNSFGAKVANPELGFFYAYSYDMNDEPVPLQREWTSQSPTLLLRDGRTFMVLGSAGSNRIPGSIVRIAVNVIDHGMTLEEAMAARRWYMPDEQELRIEVDGLPQGTWDALEAMGYALHTYPEPDGYFARVHAVMVDPASGTLYGAGDLRDYGGAGGR